MKCKYFNLSKCFVEHIFETFRNVKKNPKLLFSLFFLNHEKVFFKNVENLYKLFTTATPIIVLAPP